MRVGNTFMKPITNSLYSCEKDAETIIKKLFVSSQPYSDILKRLLIINTKDCLDENNENYKKIVKNFSVKDLIENQYITLIPKIRFQEHEEVKSYMILTFDNFIPNISNPEYMDCTISFDILCHTDYWDLGDYKIRPVKIAGILKGILDESRLSGIGQLNLMGISQLVINENIAGYSVLFKATHGNDDNLAPLEEK